MKCPFCARFPSSVKQTTRPLDEGLHEGDVKRRLRKCGNCSRNFTTFEIHESLFRQINPASKTRLTRQPLLVEDTTTAVAKTTKKIKTKKRKGISGESK